MIRPDDPNSIALCIRALRTGRLTADYAPPAVADLLEAMLAAQRGMRAEINEQEQQWLMSKTHAALRTEYARGFRDAQEQLARLLPDDEALVYGLSPDFVAASEGARYVG